MPHQPIQISKSDGCISCISLSEKSGQANTAFSFSFTLGGTFFKPLLPFSIVIVFLLTLQNMINPKTKHIKRDKLILHTLLLSTQLNSSEHKNWLIAQGEGTVGGMVPMGNGEFKITHPGVKEMSSIAISPLWPSPIFPSIKT